MIIQERIDKLSKEIESLEHKNKLEEENQLRLDNEIKKRFPHICCKTLDDFKRESMAITINGQIK